MTPRPALPDDQRRVSRSIRLTADEWAAVDRQARAQHTSAAGVVRAALARLLGDGWPEG